MHIHHADHITLLHVRGNKQATNPLSHYLDNFNSKNMGSNLERQERLLAHQINCFSMSSEVHQNLIGQSEGLNHLVSAYVGHYLS